MNGLSVINSQQENGLSEINRKETGDGRKKNGHGADAVCRAYMESRADRLRRAGEAVREGMGLEEADDLYLSLIHI